MKNNLISIIIPTLNEAAQIGRTLANISKCPDLEIIVVDGGSTDQTVAIAQRHGAKVLSSTAGRAIQMNTGAGAARGHILLFLHGDTLLPNGFPQLVREAMADQTVAAGGFKLAVDGGGFALRLVETLANLRAKYFKMPYGDQAIFLKAALFNTIGGFPQIVLMEDFALIRKLSKKGSIKIVSESALTSNRRYHKLGITRTMLINQLIIVGYLFGISPTRLALWYRRGRFW